MTGIIVKGNHLGHSIGFPTANIKVLDPHKLVPANGVYAVRVLIHDQEYKGMLNIGVRPTVDGTEKTIEVHIIGFDKDVYGEELTVLFDSWIRDEQKFDSLNELKTQLQKDKIAVLKL